MGFLGVPEIWIIVGVVVLLFGGSRIPKLARSMGLGITEFKKGLKGEGASDEQKRLEGETQKEEEASKE
ncbi:MAG TPA: twin-arginine translocase TatA/TatE family subunit [Planctomycetes bacterium]|nr:twin-arginine translocase TatA/TatE family subunit [Planctomycetota bacterium]